MFINHHAFGEIYTDIPIKLVISFVCEPPKPPVSASIQAYGYSQQDGILYPTHTCTYNSDSQMNRVFAPPIKSRVLSCDEANKCRCFVKNKYCK